MCLRDERKLLVTHPAGQNNIELFLSPAPYIRHYK